MSAQHHALSIGIVTGSMSRNAGGLFNSVRQSALHLQEAEANVAVYALRDEHSSADMAAWGPVRPVVLDTSINRPLRHAPGLGNAIEAGRHDVLHLHGIWGLQSLAVMRWKKANAKPTMISPRGMLDPWALRNSAWKKRLVGALFENANLHGTDCLHALNASEAESMRRYGLKNPIAIIPNGASLPASTDPVETSARKRILFLGRIHPKKGLTELVQAWKLALDHSPDILGDWELAIAGWDDGGHEASIQQQIDTLGVADSVSLVGPAFGEAKDKLLRSASAFILPSYSEGLPMSVLEAWSYRLPVLMTDQCNLPIGFEREAAIRIETEPAAMAGQIAGGLARSDLQGIGQSGRSLVEDKFTWARIAEDHLAVYGWLCRGGDRPSCVAID